MTRTEELVRLLREALPIVRADAREYYEDASEKANRDRMESSAELAARIAAAVDQEENEGK